MLDIIRVITAGAVLIAWSYIAPVLFAPNASSELMRAVSH